MAKRKKRHTDVDAGVFYFADYTLRVARSFGYEAGYEGRPRVSAYVGPELEAWFAGYDQAAAAVAAPFVKPDWEKVHAEIQSCRNPGGDLSQSGDGVQCGADGVRVVPAGDDRLGEAQPAEIRDVGHPVVPGETCVQDTDVHQQPKRNHCGIVVVVDYLNLLVRAFHASPPSAIHAVRSMFETIAGMIDRLCPEYLLFAMDGGHTVRTGLYPDYKAHRPEKPPELDAQIKLGEKALEAIGWPSLRVAGWEADDIIASVATQLNETASVVIASSDKDLVQLLATTRAYITHPWGVGSSFREADAVKKFGVGSRQLGDYLALVGDTSDGVPGVKGIGPKTAVELLTAHGTLEGVLEAARCLRIPGAAGKNLREQADIARLSRKLVTLQTDLPIGDHWERWPLANPRAGWREALVELGLGSSAQRLKQHLSEGTARCESSHVVVEWSAVNTEPVVAEPAVAERAAAEPVHRDDDVESWYPSIAACPLDASLLDKTRAFYRTALSHHAKGHMASNNFKRDCVYYQAWDDGLSGRALSVDLNDYDAAGMRLERPHVKPADNAPAAVVTKPEKILTLF